MSDTIFGKILRKEIPAEIIYEDEQAIVFKDIHPQAPTHLLIIPRKPLINLANASTQDESLLGHLLLVAKRIADQLGLQDYRIVTNNGAGAGQTVFHLHLHLLAGRSMQWPPG